MNRGLWPPLSPDPNPCGFYMWTMLHDRMCSNNPRSEDDLKGDIQRLEISVSPTEMRCAVKRVFVRCDTYVRAERNHFRHLLEIW
jgi:hypothetical protein